MGILDRKSGSAGMPRPISYAVFCLKKKMGVMPVDVKAIGADFLTGGVLKWLCGGPGGCFLYAAPDVSDRVRPSFTGWQAHERPFGFEPEMEYAANAWRWLNGTPPIPALFAAVEG